MFSFYILYNCGGKMQWICKNFKENKVAFDALFIVKVPCIQMPQFNYHTTSRCPFQTLYI